MINLILTVKPSITKKIDSEKKKHQHERIVKLYTVQEMPKESNKLDVNQESQLNSESKIFFSVMYLWWQLHVQPWYKKWHEDQTEIRWKGTNQYRLLYSVKGN